MTVANASALVVADPGPVTVPSNGIAPGGTQDFAFFNAYNPGGVAVSRLPDFTILDQANNFGPGSGYGYSYIKTPAGGASIQPGIIYGSDTNLSDNLFDLTLTSNSIHSLDIYLEYGVTDLNAVNDSSLALSVDGASAVRASLHDVKSTNLFTEFTVSGLSFGDTLEISGIGSRPYVAGVTFDINPTIAATIVPEPAGWLGLSAGLVCLAVARRRRLSM